MYRPSLFICTVDEARQQLTLFLYGDRRHTNFVETKQRSEAVIRPALRLVCYGYE